jgi:hypothetical protein
MNTYRLITQVVGTVVLVLLAIYGLLALVNGSTPFGLAVQADVNAPDGTDTASAPAAVLAGPIPQTMNYQGFLRNPDGSLTTGSYTITARIYKLAAPAAGETVFYTTQITNVTVRDGLFNIVLGDHPPLPADAFSDAPRYIGISLNGPPELIPRQRLHAVPWALTATTLVDDASINGLRSQGNVTVTGGSDITVENGGDITVESGGDIVVENGDATVNGTLSATDLNVAGTGAVGGMLSVTDLHVAGTTNLGPHFIEPVEVAADSGAETVDWTTFQAGDYIDPSATAVILDATAAMDRPDSGDVDAEIWIRADTSSPALRFIRGKSAQSGDDVAWSAQGIFPVASDLSFQYDVESPGFFGGFQIRLIGYFGGSE